MVQGMYRYCDVKRAVTQTLKYVYMVKRQIKLGTEEIERQPRLNAEQVKDNEDWVLRGLQYNSD